jgi:hypothetical protein
LFRIVQGPLIHLALIHLAADESMAWFSYGRKDWVTISLIKQHFRTENKRVIITREYLYDLYVVYKLL